MTNIETGKLAVFLFSIILFVGCGNTKSGSNESSDETHSMNKTTEDNVSFVLTSTAFKEGESIPRKYTCDGEDISPPLKWASAPAGVKTFALIVDDPDAPMGTWVHWVAFNIPPTGSALPEKVPPKDSLPDGTVQGKNDFRKIGYGGPCPPGGTHRYFFKLYALDTLLTLKSGSSKADLVKAMDGHIVAQAQLMGRYSH